MSIQTNAVAKPDKDVLDIATEHIQKQEAYQILQRLGAFRAAELLGAAKGFKFLTGTAFAALVTALQELEESGDWRLVPKMHDMHVGVRSAHSVEFHRKWTEVLEVFEIPAHVYYDAKKAKDLFGVRAAQSFVSLGLPYRLRYSILIAPADCRKEIEAILADEAKPLKAKIAEISAIASSLTEAQKARADEAERDATNANERAAAAEKKSDKLALENKKIGAELTHHKNWVKELETERDTPIYARGDAAVIHKRIRDAQMTLSAQVAYLEGHIFSPLVHWSENGQPNLDLNRLGLLVLVDLITTASQLYNRVLHGLDPSAMDRDYTPFWLFRSLHDAPANQQDIADHQKLLEELAAIAKSHGASFESVPQDPKA